MGHRYIGSKTKILKEVLEKIQEIVPTGSHVVDLMCGTASVSSALREAGYKVTAVDVMTYSYHHARVALLLSDLPSFSGIADFISEQKIDTKDSSNYIKILNILNELEGTKGYFWNEFSCEGEPADAKKPRNYFSPSNAERIDSIRGKIKKLHDEALISDIEHSLLLHDLIMATNDIANISGTYGHYMSKLTGRALSPIMLKPTKLLSTDKNTNHTIIKGYAEEISAVVKCDLCYIDPPYMKRQYAANYHILETLAREDTPVAVGESGLRPWRDQYSNFCTKTKIRDSFTKIFNEMQCSDFLISYSEDGLLSIADLTEFLSDFGEVVISTIEHKRFRSNNSKLDNKLTEYLIHLKIKDVT